MCIAINFSVPESEVNFYNQVAKRFVYCLFVVEYTCNVHVLIKKLIFFRYICTKCCWNFTWHIQRQVENVFFVNEKTNHSRFYSYGNPNFKQAELSAHAYYRLHRCHSISGKLPSPPHSCYRNQWSRSECSSYRLYCDKLQKTYSGTSSIVLTFE